MITASRRGIAAARRSFIDQTTNHRLKLAGRLLSGLSALLMFAHTASASEGVHGLSGTLRAQAADAGVRADAVTPDVTQYPTANATINMYAVGTGYGSGATLIATTTTDANGNWTIPDSTISTACSGAKASQLTYITSFGGSSNSNRTLNNSAIGMMSFLGACNALPAYGVNINEFSSAAAAYTMHQFMSLSGSGASTVVNIGAPSTNTYGLKSASALNTFMLNYAGGTASTNLTTYQRANMLNTLAGIIEPCIASTGASTAACTSLMSATKPSTSANGCSSITPTNTLQALLNIASCPNPSQLGTVGTSAALYAMASASTFTPILAAAPNDWTMAFNWSWVYTSNSLNVLNNPAGLALDSNGLLWVMSYSNNTVGTYNTLTPVSSIYPITTISKNSGYQEPLEVAIDSKNQAVFTTYYNGYVLQLSFNSSTSQFTWGSTYTGFSGYNPYSIAVDRTGSLDYIWASSNASTGYWLGTSETSSGALSGTAYATYMNATYVDPKGNSCYTFQAYPAYSTGITSNGSGYSLPATSAFSLTFSKGYCYTGYPRTTVTWYGGVIETSSGATNNGRTVLSGTTPMGGGSSATAGTTEKIGAPYSLATDSSGSVWGTDYSTVAGSTGSLFKITNPGTSSTTTTFTGGGIAAPAGLAIDGNGNVWVANNCTTPCTSISEFNNSGTALSPATTGFVSADTTMSRMNEPSYVAIDEAGNVWVSNYGNSTLTEFIGAATPVLTPRKGNPAKP